MDKILTYGLPILVIFLIILYLVSTYNKLIAQREFVRNAMGNIAAQIESRWDAVKNMIDATKKYSEHEAGLLTDITAKRSRVSQTSSPQEINADDNLFEQAVSRINVVAENYPQLKADQVYVKSMDAVDKYENNVRTSRMIFNDTVTKFNRNVLQFPSSIIAKLFGFGEMEYFKNTDTKTDMPSW